MFDIEKLQDVFNKFINDFGKNVKILSQDLQNKKANDEQLKSLIINMMNGNESALLNTPYVRELVQIK